MNTLPATDRSWHGSPIGRPSARVPIGAHGAGRWMLQAVVFCASLIGGSAAAHAADTRKLSVTLSVSDLPTQVTLCRDEAAIENFSVDGGWQILIDVDGSNATGNNGIDAVIQANTTPPGTPCDPSVVATEGNVYAGLYAWDEGNGFSDTGVPVQVHLDFVANTVRVSVPVTDVLTNLSSVSDMAAIGFAGYTSMAEPLQITDSTASIHTGNSIADPEQDVVDCNLSCTTNTDWYRMADLTGIRAAIEGASNTLLVEFELAALPAMMSLCRYPAHFTIYGPGSDSSWFVLFNLDASLATGDPALDGTDAIIYVATTSQQNGCVTHSAAIDTTLAASLLIYDANDGYVSVTSLPLSVSAPSGKIIVQADRSLPALAGLTQASALRLIAQGIYSGGEPYGAQDEIDNPVFGQIASDPKNDLSQCNSPCTTSVNWYAQVDFASAGVRMDQILHSDFE